MIRITATTLLLAGSALAAFPGAPATPAAPAAAGMPKPAVTAPAAPKPPTPEERGAYLSTILGCAGCHTPWGATGRDLTKLYGGSPPKQPGKAGTPNITPDSATGLGKWTEAQVIAAIREARRPDGARLSHHMPSDAYHALTDDDAKALAAFLRTVKPVVQEIPRAKGQGKGKDKELLNLPPAKGNVDPVDDPLKHGAYLAGLLRCSGCHTPRAGAVAGKLYAGGNEFGKGWDKPGKVYSSNLTSDPGTGLGKWTQAEVVTGIRQLLRPDHTEIGGPMTWHKDEWAQLTDADANALAAFVKAIPPVANKVPAATAN